MHFYGNNCVVEFYLSYPYQLVPAPDGGEAAPLAPAVVGLQGENGMLKSPNPQCSCHISLKFRYETIYVFPHRDSVLTAALDVEGGQVEAKFLAGLLFFLKKYICLFC